LQQEQQYQVERHSQVGQAAGYGIVEGFNVSAVSNKSALSITGGLGLNRRGDVIHLAADKVTLPIQPITADTTPLRRPARFEVCDPDDPDQPAAVTSGAYLLTATPLAQLEGFVPRRACDGTGTSNCANQWEVEGVEFKIIRLDKYKAPTGNRAKRNRNLLAHWFYGSDKINGLMRDPLKFPANYTGFSAIPAVDFNECDLPLAVFYWAGNKIDFVDEWAVRRRPIHPYPAKKWAANLSDQRTAEGQARYLQFQDHIADLQAEFGTKTDDIRAVDRFAFLPPVGILPVNPFELIVADVFDDRILERQLGEIKERGLDKLEVLDRVRVGVLGSLGSKNAFNLERFFGDLLSPDYLIVHEDFVHDRLHQSWVQPPILLPPPPTITGGFFDFTLLDGTLVAVNENNFASVIANMSNNFTGAVYTPKTVKPVVTIAGLSGAAPVQPGAESAARRIGRALTGTAETVPGFPAAGPSAEINATVENLNLLANIGLIKENFTLRPPIEIFIPPRGGDDDEVEPLIDIMVVDELLDPYRDQLGDQMVGRIDDAITALSGNGGIFIGTNQYTAVNNTIANAFTLNNFLWQGANFGFLDIANLFQFIQIATPPIFYVVFARRRPPVVRRPLRL
jgi:hypothetical protein